jgi:hypothetical protein
LKKSVHHPRVHGFGKHFLTMGEYLQEFVKCSILSLPDVPSFWGLVADFQSSKVREIFFFLRIF